MIDLRKKLFHPKTLLDDAYEISILLKALSGIIETVAGISLLFVSPERIHAFVLATTRANLAAHPHAFVASHLLSWSAHLGDGAVIYASTYLLIHGVLKIGIVIALLFKKRWAFPAAIAIFSLFTAYQIIATVSRLSLGMGLLSIYDIITIWLIWMEYKRSTKRLARGD